MRGGNASADAHMLVLVDAIIETNIGIRTVVFGTWGPYLAAVRGFLTPAMRRVG
jgi:hypothetical protein